MNGLPVVMLAAMRRTSRRLGALVSEPAATGWRALAMKIEAYEIYRRAQPLVREGGQTLSLDQALARVSPEPPRAILWTSEGIGHAHAARMAAVDPARWLSQVAAAREDVRVPVLTGTGLALAEARLPALRRMTSEERARVLAGDLARWRSALPDGFAEPLVESQGFAARLLQPALAEDLGRCWERLDVGPWYWHGSGRAAYFEMRFALPTSTPPWRSPDLREAMPQRRVNLFAGLAFAVTLVTMPEPPILERVLRAVADGALAAAATHGILSALAIWHGGAPHDPYLEAWRRHVPADAETARLWQSLAAGPAESALGSSVERRRRPADLFAFQDAAALPVALR